MNSAMELTYIKIVSAMRLHDSFFGCGPALFCSEFSDDLGIVV